MTQEDSMDWEENEIDLNDERGPQYRSVQSSFNIYRMALSLGLGITIVVLPPKRLWMIPLAEQVIREVRT